MRSSVEEWSWISPSPNSMVEPVSLKSNRVATSRWAWLTAFRTSWRSTSETTSKVGTSQTLSFLFAVLGRCPSGQRELTVNQPAQPTEVRILPGPPGVKVQVRALPGDRPLWPLGRRPESQSPSTSYVAVTVVLFASIRGSRATREFVRYNSKGDGRTTSGAAARSTASGRGVPAPRYAD